MKIRTRVLNPGETFCCRISSFKKYFSETTLVGHFADLGREYAVFLNSFEDTYLKKNVKGYVIASTTMCCLYDEPAVCFYAIPKQYFDEKKKEEVDEARKAGSSMVTTSFIGGIGIGMLIFYLIFGTGGK